MGREKGTKNYRWCVCDDRAICFSNKTQDKVHNNHSGSRNPLSALFSSYQSVTEGFVWVFFVLIQLCLNVRIYLYNIVAVFACCWWLLGSG